MKKLIIIGGGAAGFFAAAQASELGVQAVILEQADKVLQKVKVSGGGRCNVTNAVFNREEMPQYYPRGWKLMRKMLGRFSAGDTVKWFESHGAALYSQSDHRMFPVTNRSQTIIDCLTGTVESLGGHIVTGAKVTGLQPEGEKWTAFTADGRSFTGDGVLFAPGSSPFMARLLEGLGVKMIPAVPSLFTFRISDDRIAGLAGISLPGSRVRIEGMKFQSDGPLLITHWGLSGPAVLKLSSWAARDLSETGYAFSIGVNWTGRPPDTVRADLQELAASRSGKQIANQAPYDIPKRLWERLFTDAGFDAGRTWGDLGKKGRNRLTEVLTNTLFRVGGKSTFKEEFVTCGGVSLNTIRPDTMEHRRLPGLYFAGEVLDIDGITGGYNFQAAWSTAAVAARAFASKP